MEIEHARMICGGCNIAIDYYDECGQPFDTDERIGCIGEERHICSACLAERGE